MGGEKSERGIRSGKKHGGERRDKRRPSTNTESQELIKGARQRHCWDKKERTGRLKGTWEEMASCPFEGMDHSSRWRNKREKRGEGRDVA